MTSLRTVQEILDLIAKATHARDAHAVRLVLADFTAAVADGDVDASHASIVYRAGGDAYKAIRAANRQTRGRSSAPRPAEKQQVLPADHFTTVSAPDWAAQLLAAGCERGVAHAKAANKHARFGLLKTTVWDRLRRFPIPSPGHGKILSDLYYECVSRTAMTALRTHVAIRIFHGARDE
jgi:hypothetical protein